jgi:hypothetical protein
MLALLFLISYDSLPPLPDLSTLDYPEPALWVEPAQREIMINGFAGQFRGVGVDFDLGHFLAAGNLTKKDEWDSTDAGKMALSYRVTLPRLWIKPKIEAQLLRRQDEYQQITPGIEFTLFTSPLIANGILDYTRWLINDEHSSEASGELSIVFDRIAYLPGLTVKGIQTQGAIKPSMFARLNFHSFHLALGSAIKTGFPSPNLEVTYKEPWIEIAANVQTGVKHNMLKQYFDPDFPIKYQINIPAETLKVSLGLIMQFNVAGQYYRLVSSYQHWLQRLNIGEGYEISTIRDIKEADIHLSAKNCVIVKKFAVGNTVHLHYDTSDSAIAFLPDIDLADTLWLSLGIVELSTDFRYISQRNGIAKTLPPYHTINTTLGFRLWSVKLYLAVHNITDDNSEIYDNYRLTGRQYAGGIEIEQHF